MHCESHGSSESRPLATVCRNCSVANAVNESVAGCISFVTPVCPRECHLTFFHGSKINQDTLCTCYDECRQYAWTAEHVMAWSLFSIPSLPPFCPSLPLSFLKQPGQLTGCCNPVASSSLPLFNPTPS